MRDAFYSRENLLTHVLIFLKNELHAGELEVM